MFLRNAWYVAALAKDVRRELQPLTVLGGRIVLYRLQNGDAVAVHDACPHRKLPLSKGTLIGNHLQCGYHGLTFDRNGQCVAAPTQDVIPPTATVRSYPVCEKFGLIWIWMGSPELATLESLPTIENFDDPAWTLTTGDEMDCACNYLHLVDNLLDPSHVAWVHRSSFGAGGTEDTNIEVGIEENGVVASRWILNREPPPFYADLLGSKQPVDRLQQYEVQYPSVAINRSVFTDPGRGGDDYEYEASDYMMVSYNFLTPIDESNTRYFWLQHRNSQQGDEEVTRQIAAGARAAFEEDRDILEAVQIGMDNKDSPNITLGIDAAASQFRRALHKKILAEQSSAK